MFNTAISQKDDDSKTEKYSLTKQFFMKSIMFALVFISAISLAFVNRPDAPKDFSKSYKISGDPNCYIQHQEMFMCTTGFADCKFVFAGLIREYYFNPDCTIPLKKNS